MRLTMEFEHAAGRIVLSADCEGGHFLAMANEMVAEAERQAGGAVRVRRCTAFVPGRAGSGTP